MGSSHSPGARSERIENPLGVSAEAVGQSGVDLLTPLGKDLVDERLQLVGGGIGVAPAQ
jgi:hypothetical protein